MCGDELLNCGKHIERRVRERKEEQQGGKGWGIGEGKGYSLFLPAHHQSSRAMIETTTTPKST